MASITQIRNLVDPHRQKDFKVMIANIPGSGVGADVVSLRVTSSNVPGFSSEVLEVSLGGHVVKYAGRGMYTRTWNCSIIEGWNAEIHKRFRAWHRLQWDPIKGTVRPASEYKTTATVEMLDGLQVVQHTSTIQGVFIEDYPDLPLDAASSEATRIEITFSFDFWDDA